MAFSSDGTLFFADGGVLRRLSANGTVTVIYNGGKESRLRGLATAPRGGVLAADMMAKTVLRFDPEGRVSTLYRATDKWLPTAVALADERLLVLEANADSYEYDDRVRVIEVIDGRAKVIARPAQPESAQPSTKASSTDRSHLWGGIVLLVGLAASATLFAAWRLHSGRPAG
jgi:sugar lactone lactonase YvrE